MSARRFVNTCAEDKRQQEKIQKRRETPLPKFFLFRANPMALVRMTSDSRDFQTQSLLGSLPNSRFWRHVGEERCVTRPKRLRGRLLARRIRTIILLHTFTRFLEFPQHKEILAFVFAHFSFNSSQSPISLTKRERVTLQPEADHQPLLGFPGSLYVPGKLPTYPPLSKHFCPKWEVSVNVGLGEG